MKRTITMLAAFCLLAAMLCVPAQAADRSVTPVEDFEYTVQPSGAVLLTVYTGKGASVVVADSYQIGGINYSVVLDSKTVFRGNQVIESVTLQPGVAFLDNTMAALFAECSNLRSVYAADLNTAAVTSMAYLFYGCEKLKGVDFSGWNTGNVVTMRGMFSGCNKLTGLKDVRLWNTARLTDISFMFNQTSSLQSLDLSHWDLSQLKNSAWCFQYCKAADIRLPDDLAIISAGFLNHAVNYTGSSFTVPAGVKTIGYAHTFYDFATDDFTEFRVATGNAAFKTVDGILYSGDGQKLLAIPRGKTFPDGVYRIPEGVTFLGELSFSRNYHVKEILLPDSYLLKTVPLYDPAYITYEDIGNLNAGLNLNIAIYLYTGVTTYSVSNENPNYRSVDGIIYSKDMTTLLAVPTRYDRYLQIPEGVAVWRSNAMWYGDKSINSLMGKCTGVYIPASMTDIADNQLSKLNWLAANSDDFRITVHNDNPVYYINKTGQLVKKAYLADLDIRLAEETLIYDGTPKTPAVTITYGGKQLQPDRDYTVEYADNVDAGTAWMRITARKNFYGTAEKSFVIEKAAPAYTAPQSTTATYGQLLQELPLPEGFQWSDPLQPVGNVGDHIYYLSYSNGDLNYRTVEEIPMTVTVQPKALSVSPAEKLPLYAWTGRPLTPQLAVMDGERTVPADEYTVTYENHVGIGLAVITVTDAPAGNYTISGTQGFLIVPEPLLVYGILIAVLTLLAFGLDIRNKKAALLKTQPETR